VQSGKCPAKSLKNSTDDINFKEFSETIRDWRTWQEKAHSLRRAAIIIRNEALRDWDNRKIHGSKTVEPPALEGVITFLNGSTIENLVKALWVQKNDPVNKKGELDEKLQHKLKVLLMDVEFELLDGEIELLLRIENYVKWAGRYPMPRTPKLLGDVSKRYVSLNVDEELISQFIDRLEERLSTTEKGI
jgi:hypothetical protein